MQASSPTSAARILLGVELRRILRVVLALIVAFIVVGLVAGAMGPFELMIVVLAGVLAGVASQRIRLVLGGCIVVALAMLLVAKPHNLIQHDREAPGGTPPPASPSQS